MKIATVLINYNDEENTIKLTNKLKKYKNISKIVIVDNCSSNVESFNKIKILESENIDVIRADKNGGYNYGLNYGIHFLEKQAEEFDIYMCSNTDIKISENAVETCIKTLNENNDVALVAPRMLDKNSNSIRRSAWKLRTFSRDIVHSTRILELLFYFKLRAGEYKEEDFKKEKLEVEAISGACFFIKSKILKEINYFDENVFLFYEEDILGKTLKEKGYKTYSLNNINFIHYESQSIGKTINYYKKMFQLFKSKMYYQKYYNNINWLQSFIFYLLWGVRNIELVIEIPIRKLLGK
jgi:GT2 family glycosyltransferase